MNRELKEFYSDLDDLYAWMEDIYKVTCVKSCNACCTVDTIWLLLPELMRLNKEAKVRKVEFGCPFRTKKGCSNHALRPLICRSFGAKQLLHMPMASLPRLNVNVAAGIQTIAGPGVCDKVTESSVDLESLKKIYACYVALAKKWGLVAIGNCDDLSLQERQVYVTKEMQQGNLGYKVFCNDGIPEIYSVELKGMYKDFLP